MTITRLTAEQAQRREREYRQFKAIERKLEERPRVTRGGPPPVIRKKPTVVEKFIKPKDISPAALKKKQILVRKWEKKDLPKWVTDFMGDPLKLSGRERKLVLPFYGKSSADALKQKSAMTSYLNYVSKEVKKNPAKAVLFAALPPAFKIAGRGIRAAGITKLITKIPHGETISKGSLKLISAGVGATYTHNILERVTEPVITGYRDGEVIKETSKTLPNGDIEITQDIEQIPTYRMPTGAEQHERIGGIFATELAPIGISHRIISRGIKTGYKPEPKPKPKVKVTTKIKRAGKVIKTTPAKIKTLPKKIKKVPTKIKTKAQKAKEAKVLKKRHEKLEKDIKAAEKKFIREKVKVLKVTKGELKIIEKTRKQLLKDQVKAKGKERKLIQKRIKQVERELAFKTAFKPKKKIVKLSDSTYSNITKLSKLKAKIKALIDKIRAIPAHVAKRMGLNKTKEIKKLTVRLREVDVVKSYVVMIQKGATKKTVVEKLSKLPENKLQVLDTKTGKIVKNTEKAIEDFELRVIKPSKKPPVEYKEVKVGKGQVQLQKQKQKQTIKTVQLIKTEVKTLQSLKTEAKTIAKSKPKTKTEMKIRQKQLQKIKTKIKSKQKQLLVYRGQLTKEKTKLKQTKEVFLTIPVPKPIPKERIKEIVKIINTTILNIDNTFKIITEVIQIPIPVPISITIPKPKPVVMPIIKPIIPPPILKRKVKPKKKKKMTGAQYRDWFVVNQIPTLKSLYG